MNFPARRGIVATFAGRNSHSKFRGSIAVPPAHQTIEFPLVLILLLIVIAGAAGTFLGIITVILKNERTTNRHQLLTNIPASVALGAIISVLPGGLLYVLTDSLVVTGFGSVLSGFLTAWVMEALDH
jgi:hypothetical protein